MSRRSRRIATLPLRATAGAVVLGALALTLAPGLPAASAADRAAPLPAALAGEALPVLVRVAPGARGETLELTLALAPGEAPRGAEVSVATADGRTDGLTVRVLERHPDGSASRIGVSARNLLRAGADTLLLVRPPRVADPTALRPVQGASSSGGAGITAFGGAVASLVERGLWHGQLAADGSSTPPWWDEAEARFPVGSEPDDLDGRITFVQSAYAEKGRPRRAIRLFREIATAAWPGGEGGEGRAGAAVPPDRLRAWLRACHEIAHLYEAGLQDDARGLGWSLRCAGAPLTDPAEERQNRIASGLGALRALEGLGRGGTAVALYRVLARDLLLDPDPYGTLLLPQIFVAVGDAELAAGREDRAKAAYRAAVGAADRLPDGVPSNYLAPGSVARASLRRLDARGLALARVPDGSYEGEAYGYNAPVEVRMTFDGGRCTALHVTDLGDKRPLDAYRVLPDRILATQSLEVDAVTGATVTSRAIVSAATDAVFTAAGERSDGGGTTRGD